MDPVKQKIQELVPEVMELKFGCRIKITDRKFDSIYDDGINTVLTYTGDGMYIYNPMGEELYYGKKFQILGRPIQLADVLRAIDCATGPMGVTGGRHIVVNWRGGFCEYKCQNGEMGLWMIGPLGGWNLTTDYDGQSPETKAFLGGLLGVELKDN